jgi:hypothetical protein
MPWYTAERQNSGRSRRPTEHAYTNTTKRLQVCGSCDKELRSSRHRRRLRDPTGRSHRDWMPNESLLLECTDTIMSSQCTTHRSPSSACMCPSARNAVRLAVYCFVGRVACCCLYHPPSASNSSSFSAEEGGAQNVQVAQWRTLIIPRLRLAPPVPYTL